MRRCRQESWFDGWKGEGGDGTDTTLHVGEELVSQERNSQVSRFSFRPKHRLTIDWNSAVLLNERKWISVRLESLGQEVQLGVDGVR